MDMNARLQTFDELLLAVRRIAKDTAAPAAAQVDAQARFPHEAIDALKRIGALSAPVPRELGGAGLGMRQLGQLCATLAGACGSSGMVLAMHYIQVASIARHLHGNECLSDFLRNLVASQWLLASMTSEVGTFGDTRSSVCALQPDGAHFKLEKDATTGSYCAHADAILVTCRRDADAPRSDQVLVLVRRADCTLTQTTSWDTLGMRGTCSPGFRLQAHGDLQQVIPGPFADGSAETMVPYSHILWSALWSGIAADALGKAATFVRNEARKNPGVLPANATRLAEAHVQLQALRSSWQVLADEFDSLAGRPDGRQLLQGMAWALKMTNLKIASSEAAPRIVHQALQIIGILAYKNDSPFSLGRHYRDALSGSLMISNDRILAKSAQMLMVVKED